MIEYNYDEYTFSYEDFIKVNDYDFNTNDTFPQNLWWSFCIPCF